MHQGTGNFLKAEKINVSFVNKVIEGRPHIVDMIKNKNIALIFNTTEGKQSISDSFSLDKQPYIQMSLLYYYIWLQISIISS